MAMGLLGVLSSYLNLTGYKTIPISVQIPFLTAGGLVLNALAARIFFKEKLTVPIIIGLVLITMGIILFVL